MILKSTLSRITSGILLSLAAILTASAVYAAAAWPGSTSGTQIASGLTAYNSTSNGFEASGVEYLDGYGYIVNGDDGDLAVLDSSGNVLEYWWPSGDLEDVTITDTTSTDHLIYLANETGSKIEQFSLATESKTGLSWTLSDLYVNGGAGFEALAYVPAEDAPASWGTAQSGGFFVAASQAKAELRVYTFNRNGSSTVTSVAEISVSYTDVAALQYNTQTELLYVVFDSAGKMKEYSLTGTIVSSYQLPTYGTSASDEGVVVIPDCDANTAKVVITNDGVSSSVSIYDSYEIACVTPAVVEVDEDGDTYAVEVDCNDNDATINANQTYYRDTDGDGLGDVNNPTGVCSYTVPTGYVTNASDANDSDYDNDSVSTSVDCNDADATISANQTYYADVDGDGLGDPNSSVTQCSYAVPTGYVTNNSDTNDVPAPTPEPVPEPTPEPTPDPEPEVVVPDVPTNLTITKLALRRVLLDWDGNGEYYTVKLTDTGTKKTVTFDNIPHSYRQVGKNYIRAGHSYEYTVRACDTDGCSEYSANKSFNSYTLKQWRKVKRLRLSN